MAEMRDLARFFRALGDETRLRLVSLLAQQEPERALCVGRLAHELGVTTSNVSQHLRVLKDLGLVRAERRRYRLHYYLEQDRLAAYQNLVRQQLGDGFVPGGGHRVEREEVSSMGCCNESGCCHPEEKREPTQCTPEQIRECHGDVAEHPCEGTLAPTLAGCGGCFREDG